MSLCTVGIKHYIDYCLSIKVTKDLDTLLLDEAQEYYKILYIEAGTLHIIINDKEFILTGANAICLNHKDKITICDKSQEDIYILYFKPDVINTKFNLDICECREQLSITDSQDFYYLIKFKHDVPVQSKIVQLYMIDSSIIKQKLQTIQNMLDLQDNQFWPCRSRTCLFEILFALCEPDDIEDNQVSNQNLIESSFSKLTTDVIYYLQTYYNKKITIEKLAQIFHTNRTTLLADFKKSTGQSINHYIIQLRMTMAATLLRDTYLSINEICERTGFSDVSYFSKSFKKILQLTPSEYRKINATE